MTGTLTLRVLRQRTLRIPGIQQPISRAYNHLEGGHALLIADDGQQVISERISDLHVFPLPHLRPGVTGRNSYRKIQNEI
jgi:hypothetical protein